VCNESAVGIREASMRFVKNAVALLICLFVILAVVQPGGTDTSRDYDVICPLCHTVFKASAYRPGSRLGVRLDLKPLGPAVAPARLPQCPKCRFIVYDPDLNEKDREMLRKFVDSKAYKDISGDSPTYFLLARIYKVAGMDSYETAHTYLKASWQVDKDRVKCAKYLEASYAEFQSFLSSNKEMSSKYIMAELLSGEIERRLGKFDQALGRFSRIQKAPEFVRSENVTSIIDYQLELIGARDTEPHEIKM
jgi:hypothetical protein